MIWNIKVWDDLTTAELYAILRLRAEVFVVEQTCAYQDIDHKDQQSIHLFLIEENHELKSLECSACLRLVKPGISYIEWSIGRVATSKEARGKGLGKELMQRGMQYLRDHEGNPPIRISAQCYLKLFYESFGFYPVSESYLEDDIPHIEMLYNPN